MKKKKKISADFFFKYTEMQYLEIGKKNTKFRSIWKYEKIYAKLCNIRKYATIEIFKYAKKS